MTRVLSADIRAGIKLDGPQAFGRMFTVNPGTGRIEASCALGCAALAAGLVDPEEAYFRGDEAVTPEPSADLIDLYPDATERRLRCPVGGLGVCGHPDDPPHATAFHRVPHLNDHHRWSRERIADWLEENGL